jgi:Flp pilus assembly protein TadD
MNSTIPSPLAALMEAAVTALEGGDFERADDLLRRIVAQNPRDADAWHMLAILAIRGGRSDEAIECARRAHQLDRRNHLYLNTLGVAHGELGQLDESVRWLKRALKERPTHAESHYNLGKAYAKLGQTAEAERSYLRARQLDPKKAEVANNIAVLYARQGRYSDALPLLAEARIGMPDDEMVVINSAMAKLATSGPDAAILELESFIKQHPHAAAAHAELGRRLLAEGRFAEGWREYAWRHHVPITQLPADLQERRVLLLPDQGLGDHLFFLRFARQLRQRAARTAFACPQKLLALLEGNDAIDDLCARGCAASDFDLALPLGDLPRLLNDTSTPPPVRLVPKRVSEWRERLAALGPEPYLGVTWRAGSKREIEAEFAVRGEDPLYKEIDIKSLASALQAWRGTVLILQRLPAQGENEAFSKAQGRGAHDLSALNDDLVDMAAVLSLIEEYVGVSNTNMHLRAGVQKAARVLVPFPPEFRWMNAGDVSPWFPGFAVYRQAPARDWRGCLERLKSDLSL